MRHGVADTNRNRSLIIFENLFLHVHPVKVRKKTLDFSHTYWLGGITLACALVLIATGILLMFYYHPSVPQAYRDMKELAFVVENGMFLRNLHRWAAHLMVFAAFLHMLRVFYHHAYRPPRQFNWVVGVDPAARDPASLLHRATCFRGTSSPSGASRSERTWPRKLR